MKITDLLYASKGASWIDAAKGLDVLTCKDKDRDHKMRELMKTTAEISSILDGCYKVTK